MYLDASSGLVFFEAKWTLRFTTTTTLVVADPLETFSAHLLGDCSRLGASTIDVSNDPVDFAIRKFSPQSGHVQDLIVRVSFLEFDFLFY